MVLYMKLTLKYHIFNYYGFKSTLNRFELKCHEYPYIVAVGQNNFILKLKINYQVSNERMFKWY